MGGGTAALWDSTVVTWPVAWPGREGRPAGWGTQRRPGQGLNSCSSEAASKGQVSKATAPKTGPLGWPETGAHRSGPQPGQEVSWGTWPVASVPPTPLSPKQEGPRLTGQQPLLKRAASWAEPVPTSEPALPASWFWPSPSKWALCQPRRQGPAWAPHTLLARIPRAWASESPGCRG